MLEKIQKTSSESLEENGWTATNFISFADVYLFTWMSIFVYNPLIKDATEIIIKKFPKLERFYTNMLKHNSGVLQKYIDTRPKRLY